MELSIEVVRGPYAETFRNATRINPSRDLHKKIPLLRGFSKITAEVNLIPLEPKGLFLLKIITSSTTDPAIIFFMPIQNESGFTVKRAGRNPRGKFLAHTCKIEVRR